MRQRGYELKVGLFVLVGLIILTVIIFSIGDIYFYKPGYHLKAIFSFVNGMDEGAPVRLAGVDVGEVEKIDVFRNEATQKTMAEVSLWVKKKIPVEKDAMVYVNTLGLFGEKYIEIIPGTEGAGLYEDGDVIVGNDPVSVERFYEQLEKLSGKLSLTIDGINDVVGDEEVREKFKDSIKDTRELVADLRQLSATTQSVMDKVEKGQGTIGKLISDDELYNKILEMVEDLKRHPWKLLHKPKKSEIEKEEQEPEEKVERSWQ